MSARSGVRPGEENEMDQRTKELSPLLPEAMVVLSMLSMLVKEEAESRRETHSGKELCRGWGLGAAGSLIA